jgi:hypothetical protein
LALAASAAAGCAAVSLDGLTGGGGPEGGVGDGTVEAAPEAGGADSVGPDASLGADGDASTPVNDSAPDARQADSAPDAMDAADVYDAATSSDAPADASDAPDAADAADAAPEASEASTGPVACADAGVILCDDFENGLDTTKWPFIAATNATTVVDTSLAHRGTRSLHTTAFAVAADAGPTNIDGTLGHQGALPKTFYERLFVYFASPLPSENEAFTVALQGHAPFQGLQLEAVNGDITLTDFTGASAYVVSSTVATPGTWHCIEWELVQGDAGVGQMATWWDGQPIAALQLSNVPMLDLGELQLGISFYQVTAQPAYDLWIDDVYVDTSPVGCAK